MINKNAVAPVIAISLLLVVAVVVSLSFGDWFAMFSTSKMTGIEEDTMKNNNIQINDVIGTTLYLKSDTIDYIQELKIKDGAGNVLCEIGGSVDAPVQPDTFFLMNFDEGTATDLSGNDYDGTLNLGVDCSVAGISGQACLLDGVDDNIDLGNPAIINKSRYFTVSTWVKTTDSASSNGVYTEQHYVSDSVTMGIGVFVGKARFQVHNQTLGGWQGVGTKVVSDGQWHHIVGTFSLDDGMTMYVDGVLDENKPGNTWIQTTSANPTIGLAYSVSTPTWVFNGTVDELSIYSKALTGDEVKTLYLAKKALLYEQILSSGVNQIDVSDCGLQKGLYYKVSVVTSQNVFDKTIEIK